jgi:hypothetical protein
MIPRRHALHWQLYNLLGCDSTHFLDLKVRADLPIAAVGSGSFFALAFLPVILLTIPPFEAIVFFVTIVVPLLNSESWLPSLERGCFDSDSAAAARLTRTVPVFATYTALVAVCLLAPRPAGFVRVAAVLAAVPPVGAVDAADFAGDAGRPRVDLAGDDGIGRSGD